MAVGALCRPAMLCLACLMAACTRSLADAGLPEDSYDLPTTEYASNSTYDDSFDEFAWGGDTDAADASDNNYYGDDFDNYYDMVGTYTDQYGDDYFFDDAETDVVQCSETEPGKANLTGDSCDLTIKGADELADKLQGGVDGTYELSGCHQGWPKYVRKGKKGARTLFFSTYFKDWDISEGAEPNETTLLVFGGGTLEFTRPNAVPKDQWHLSSKYMSASDSTDSLNTFPHINLTVACSDGTEIESPRPPIRTTQSLLTDDEADAKYRDIYTQAHEDSREPATVNFFMVVSVLLAGMGVVMGLPYLLFKKKDAPGATWMQQLEDGRKKRVGHVS